MDSEAEDIYLQKIEEFVYDEDKIVTVRWLSITLDINIAESKRLLQKYVSDHRDSKPDDLAVSYLLSGTHDEGVLAIQVVKEDELEDKRDALITVLNQQIYSVQKCKQIDLNAVSSVDYFDMQSPRDGPIIGSVISKNCIKRVFKPKKLLPPPAPPTIKGKASFFTKIPPKTTEKTDTNTNGVKQEPAVTKQKEQEPTKPNKSKGIANFFTQASQKSSEKASVKMEVDDVKMEVDDIKAPKDRLANLVDSDSESECMISPTQNKVSKENDDPKPKRNKRTKKQTKKNGPSPKRRKRIVEHNNSDSDDIFGSDTEMPEDVVENSEDDSDPVLKPKPALAPLNKKRKQIDRTYTDEDGYVITKKEWVEESASEEELVEPEKIEVKVEIKKEVSKAKVDDLVPGDKVVNGKGKGGKGKKGVVAANQQTLMSFFKRK